MKDRKFTPDYLYRVDLTLIYHALISTPLAYKVVDAAVAKIPDDEELGEKLIEICLLIVGKAVKLTKTTADDELFEKVSCSGNQRLRPRETVPKGTVLLL